MNRKPIKAKSFPRSHKLTKKSDFLRLRSNSRKLVSRHWIVFYQKNGTELPRVATTVSARFGNAVRRNRFKRWIRENFRHHKEDFKGYDVHFVAKNTKYADDKELVRREMREDFTRLLRHFRP